MRKDTGNGYLSLRVLFGAEFHFGIFIFFFCLNAANVIHQCIVASTVYLSRGVTQLTPNVSAESMARLQRSSLVLSQSNILCN